MAAQEAPMTQARSDSFQSLSFREITTANIVTSPQLQRILHCSKSTLRRWRSIGLPSLGGRGIRFRYDLDAVLQWLDDQQV